MHAVVLHENGRIDAEDLVALCRRGKLLYDAGMQPAKYAVLELCEHQTQAGVRAQELRRMRRERQRISDSGGAA